MPTAFRKYVELTDYAELFTVELCVVHGFDASGPGGNRPTFYAVPCGVVDGIEDTLRRLSECAKYQLFWCTLQESAQRIWHYLCVTTVNSVALRR